MNCYSERDNMPTKSNDRILMILQDLDTVSQCVCVCVCVFDLQMRSLRKEKYTAAGDSISVCKSS